MSARVILYNAHVYVLYTVFTVIANKQSNINEDTKKACAEVFSLKSTSMVLNQKIKWKETDSSKCLK